ncbi:hypothetical protein U0070_003444 [Myodes glareolus]|uniref:Secreted protein n=1 Tax=Myodes glareolus TaxID=447135 RepID=A0AAW0JTF4_MYOGA
MLLLRFLSCLVFRPSKWALGDKIESSIVLKLQASQLFPGGAADLYEKGYVKDVDDGLGNTIKTSSDHWLHFTTAS